METLIFFLAFLVASGGLADFLIGEKNDRKSRNMLVDLYIVISEGDWSQNFRVCGRAIVRFLDQLFGPAEISFRYIFAISRYSLTISIFIAIFYTVIDSINSIGMHIFERFDITTVITPVLSALINLIADIISWTIVRYLFDQMSGASNKRIIALSLFAFFQGYFTLIIVNIVLLMPYLDEPFSIGWSNIRLIDLIRDIEGIKGLLDPVGHPIMSTMAGPLALLSSGILIPQTLFVGTVLLCFILRWLRPILYSPLALILQRAESSKKGVFTLAAAGVAAVSTLIAAAQKAFF